MGRRRRSRIYSLACTVINWLCALRWRHSRFYVLVIKVCVYFTFHCVKIAELLNLLRIYVLRFFFFVLIIIFTYAFTFLSAFPNDFVVLVKTAT